LKLDRFPFLTDEDIHPDVVDFLRRRGCNVLDVKESGWAGSNDLALICKARAENRVILTHDSDFGTLAVLAGEPVVGIVYVRPGHIKPHFTIATLDTLFRQELSFTVPFLVVARRTGDMVRIRVRGLAH